MEGDHPGGEALFRALAEQSSDILSVLDADGTWRFSVGAGLTAMGYPQGFRSDDGLFSLLHPDDLDVSLAAFGEIAEGLRPGGGERRVVARVRAADGSWRYLETSGRNLVDDPAVRGFVLNSRDVTDRVEAERALRAERERFTALVRHSSDVILVTDPSGIFIYVSPAISVVAGYEPEELVGTAAVDWIHPDDQARVLENLAAAVDSPPKEYRVRHRDGSWLVIEATSTNRLDDPNVRGFVTNARDVTARRVAERDATRLREVLERSKEIVALVRLDGRLIWANQAAHAVLELHEGRDLGDHAIDVPRGRLRGEVLPVVVRDGTWTGELTLLRADGSALPVVVTLQAHEEDGEVALISAIAHDITELKRVERRLHHEATHDPLTALPNRTLFYELGEQALGRAARQETTTAVLYLDLDGFKAVNDRFGHETGDRVLAVLGQRLRGVLRAGDVVARLGGDEFGVLCESVSCEAEMRDLAHRLIETASLPLTEEELPLVAEDRALSVGASAGIALDHGGASTITNLLRAADTALYGAKRAGGGRSEVFEGQPESRGSVPGANEVGPE